jgi:hypothetical protein
MAEPDFYRPRISPFRYGLGDDVSIGRMQDLPVPVQSIVRTSQVWRPRRIVRALAITCAARLAFRPVNSVDIRV